MPIPILTYHALHAPGWSYADNDHVALEADLQCIRSLGFRVAKLRDIADALRAGTLELLAAQRVLGLSFDDGTDLDFCDFVHPDAGHLKSMARILREQAFDLALGGGQANATSFVIASPDARRVLDQRCIAGRGQWRDLWWYEAAASGVLDIANHSWDHLHPELETVEHSSNSRGSFRDVRNGADADRQIREAQDYLDAQLRGHRCGLFAYPYGEANSYLIDEYFPAQSKLSAAFVTGGRAVTADSSIWAIPRYVCGEHWHSEQALEALLRADMGD